MTERLYYDDAYRTEFEATVTGERPGWIALNRSAFYPTSGGQPYDTGLLEYAGGSVLVLDVEAEGDTVWHRVERPIAPGTPVRGRVDWERRFDHMQQHAADHMLAGAAWQLYGGVTIGLHLGAEDSTIDMDLPGGRMRLTAEEMDALETLVNRRVQQDDPIRCWFPDPREIEGLPLRKRPTVTEHIRVVAMGDYEMVACGGTHPRTTGQIGPVKILSSTPARGKMRLRFLSGMRAIRHYQAAARCADGVSQLLSSDHMGAAEALRREREAAQEQTKSLRQRLTQAALETLAASRRGNVYAAHLPFADHEALLRAAEALTKDPEAVALLSCPGKDARMLVFARGAAARTDMAALLRSTGARGGGKPDLAQGSAPDGEALERAKESVCGC